MVRPATVQPATVSPLTYLKRWSGGLLDWETLITMGLLLGAVTAVTAALEDGGWRSNMPPLTTVSVVAVLTGTLLARSRLSVFLAGPLAILTGAAAVGWQTLVMAGPGNLHERVIAVQDRFSAWFHIVSTNTVTNDPLPFNVLIISLTWLGVMLLVWSVYRWHNAWIGLIPGGIALFLDLALVGDDLTGAIAIYMMCGFLLVMQTNLLASIAAWRRDNVQYPGMINLTFLNFSFWVLLVLMLGAWAMPAGLSAPGPVQAISEDALEFGARFVRLAGPLQSSKVIPIHAYSGTLPFQGSISLGSRELMAVTPSDTSIQGQLLLRGSTYDDYESGGWQLGNQAVAPSLPPADARELNDAVMKDRGDLITLNIEMKAKTVIGTVIFSPGTPVTVTHDLTVQIPSAALTRRDVLIPGGGIETSDDEVLAQYVQSGEIGVSVLRDENKNVTGITVASLDQFGLVGDAEGLDPGGRIKRYESYAVTGFIPTYSADELRTAGDDYPTWVTNEFLQLPDITQRVRDLAERITTPGTVFAPVTPNPYDEAVAVQDYLRKNYSIDYNVPETPAGQDTVDYFLFGPLHRGYFDYHASAMVVMLRSLGIPSRLAVGFAVDDKDRAGDGSYTVKDSNSYAWPEVYFPGHGWVAFNPTPDRSTQTTPTISDTPLPIDGLDPGIIRFLPAGSDPIVNSPAGGLSEDVPQSGVSLGGGTTGTDWLAIGVLAFIAALIGVIALGWQRSVAGLPYPQQIWEKTVRLASWGGSPPMPGQTPHDYANGLGKRFYAVRRDFPTLADAYTKSRFGHQEIGEAQAQALKEAWPDVRGALVGSILRRAWPRRSRESRD